MPPGRKEKHKHFSKPASSYVHPSLSLRPNTPAASSSSASTSQETLPETVNARLEHLRRTQAPASPAPALEDRARPPPLTARRRVAGPPPPRSWLEGDREGRRTLRYGAGVKSGGGSERRPRRLDYFPDVNLPDRTSLQHHVLKSLAADWEWHVEYDHTFLATLPVEIKTLVLSYVAMYGPQAGLGYEGLKLLFLTPDEAGELGEQATGSAEVKRLDLGGAVGRGLTLKQLDKYWTAKNRRKETTSTSPVESWDMDMPASISSSLRFPALTHLSLAYPGPAVSWGDLLHFSRHLGALTHLSLAFWPYPALSSTMPAGEVPGEANRLLSAAQRARSRDTEDSARADAAHILKLLSRATRSLTYLSLDGCQSWFEVLYHDGGGTSTARSQHRFPHPSLYPRSSHTPHPSRELAGPEWTTCWRRITTLSLSQCWIPEKVDTEFLGRLKSYRGARAQHLVYVNAVSTQPEPTMQLRAPVEAAALPVPAADSPRLFPPPAGRAVLATGLETSIHAPPAASSSSAALRSGVGLGESYTIHAPLTVAQSIEAQTRRREWSEAEIEALKVEGYVMMLRRNEGLPVCNVLHGWDKNDLLERGYDEGKLFASGF